MSHITGTTEVPISQPSTSPVPYGGYSTIALGVTVVVGGIFLALATYQLLPHHGNIISQLGFWGEVATYGTIASGMVIIAIGSILSDRKPPAEIKPVDAPKPTLDEVPSAIADRVDVRIKKSLGVLFPNDFDFTKIYSHPHTVFHKDIVKLVERPDWEYPFAWVNISWEGVEPHRPTGPALIIKIEEPNEFYLSSTPGVVILCQKGEKPLKWCQDEHSYNQKKLQQRPPFLQNEYFTDPGNGHLVDPLYEGFKLLQKITKGELGEDREYKKWRLYQSIVSDVF